MSERLVGPSRRAIPDATPPHWRRRWCRRRPPPRGELWGCLLWLGADDVGVEAACGLVDDVQSLVLVLLCRGPHRTGTLFLLLASVVSTADSLADIGSAALGDLWPISDVKIEARRALDEHVVSSLPCCCWVVASLLSVVSLLVGSSLVRRRQRRRE